MGDTFVCPILDLLEWKLLKIELKILIKPTKLIIISVRILNDPILVSYVRVPHSWLKVFMIFLFFTKGMLGAMRTLRQ